MAAVTLGSEESKVTIQNRPTVLNTGEYTGELRWDEARSGKDLHVIDGLTVTKMSNGESWAGGSAVCLGLAVDCISYLRSLENGEFGCCCILSLFISYRPS